MANDFRILVTGSRYWRDEVYIGNFFASLRSTGGTLMHGGAQGVDDIAGRAAAAAGLRVAVRPADWATHGKAAGVLRNQAMLDEFKPTVCVAFTYNVYESKGTLDMVQRMLKAGKTVMLNPSSMANRQQVIRANAKGVLYIGLE